MISASWLSKQDVPFWSKQRKGRGRASFPEVHFRPKEILAAKKVGADNGEEKKETVMMPTGRNLNELDRGGDESRHPYFN